MSIERRAVHPEFVRRLQYDHGRSESWLKALEPLSFVIQFPNDIQTLKAHGREACIVLWAYLRDASRDTFSVLDEVFLLGYAPVLGVPLDERDLETLVNWQRIRSRLFQWSLARTTFEGTGETLFSWTKEFSETLAGIDELLLPRLDFWLAVREAERRRETTT